MKKVLVSSEVPYDLLERSVQFNDYEYCLAHEFLRNETYKNFYLEQKKKGRTVLLDNSCFELGCSVDIHVYADIINELKPDVVFLPDCYTDNSEQVLNRLYEFKDSLKKVTLNCKPKWCAVIHGSSLDDAINTWKRITTELSDFVDMLAVSKSLLLRQDAVEEGKKKYNLEDDKHADFNRYLFLKAIVAEGLYKNEPLHLLGNYGAYEFMNDFYKTLNIISVDSSHPVMVALDPDSEGKTYSEFNTYEYCLNYRNGKCTTPVLAKNMNLVVDDVLFNKMKENVEDYKKVVN